ncbi:hypothetical protein [Candidatus Reidiella endopervernicosa]|nr:hypothetical protein [Candidatus Reidiella endopervernicosa]QKQ27940.1 hypothetical protein HUE57_17870 [Candidatus Reidiella endopervernicosa]
MRKVSPLIAEFESDSRQKIVPRAAMVEPLDGEISEVVNEESASLSAEVVREAFDRFYEECMGTVNGLADIAGGEAGAAAAVELERAKQRFNKALAVWIKPC